METLALNLGSMGLLLIADEMIMVMDTPHTQMCLLQCFLGVSVCVCVCRGGMVWVPRSYFAQ